MPPKGAPQTVMNLRNCNDHDTTRQNIRSTNVTHILSREEMNVEIESLHQQLVEGKLVEVPHQASYLATSPSRRQENVNTNVVHQLSPPLPPHELLLQANKQHNAPPDNSALMESVMEEFLVTVEKSKSLQSDAEQYAEFRKGIVLHPRESEDESWRYTSGGGNTNKAKGTKSKGAGPHGRGRDHSKDDEHGVGSRSLMHENESNYNYIMQVLEEEFVRPPTQEKAHNSMHFEKDGTDDECGDDGSEADNASQDSRLKGQKKGSKEGGGLTKVQAKAEYVDAEIQTLAYSAEPRSSIDDEDGGGKGSDLLRKQREKTLQLQKIHEQFVQKTKTAKAEMERELYFEKQTVSRVLSELEAYKLYAQTLLPKKTTGKGGKEDYSEASMQKFLDTLARAVRHKIDLRRRVEVTETRCMELADHLSVTTKMKVAWKAFGRAVADNMALDTVKATEADKLKCTYRIAKTVRPQFADTLSSMADSYKNRIEVIKALNPHLVEMTPRDSMINVGDVYMFLTNVVPVATHEVHSGDTMDMVLELYGGDLADILAMNPDVPPNLLLDDVAVVKVPNPKYILHKVTVGETVDSVSAMYGAKPDYIRLINNLGDATDLTVYDIKIVPKNPNEWCLMAKNFQQMRRDAAVRDLTLAAKAAKADLVKANERVLIMENDVASLEKLHANSNAAFLELYGEIEKTCVALRSMLNIPALSLPNIIAPLALLPDAAIYSTVRDTMNYYKKLTESIVHYRESVREIHMHREAKKEKEREKEKEKQKEEKSRSARQSFSAFSDNNKSPPNTAAQGAATNHAEHRKASVDKTVHVTMHPDCEDDQQQQVAVNTSPLPTPTPATNAPTSAPVLPASPPPPPTVVPDHVHIGVTTTVVVDLSLKGLGMPKDTYTGILTKLQIGVVSSAEKHNALRWATSMIEDAFICFFVSLEDGVKFAASVQNLCMECELPPSVRVTFPTVTDMENSDKVIFKGTRPRLGVHVGDIALFKSQHQPDAPLRYRGEELEVPFILASRAQGGQTILSAQAHTQWTKHASPASKSSFSIEAWDRAGLVCYSALPEHLKPRQQQFLRGLHTASKSMHVLPGGRSGLRSVYEALACPPILPVVSVKPAWTNPHTIVCFEVQGADELNLTHKDHFQDVSSQLSTLVRMILNELEDGFEQPPLPSFPHASIVVFQRSTKAIQFTLLLQSRISTLVIPDEIITNEYFVPVLNEAEMEVIAGPRVSVTADFGELACSYDFTTQRCSYSGDTLHRALAMLSLCPPGSTTLSVDLRTYVENDITPGTVLEIELTPQRLETAGSRVFHCCAMLPREMRPRFEHLYPQSCLDSILVPTVSEVSNSDTNHNLTLVELPKTETTCAILRFDMRQFSTSKDIMRPYFLALRVASATYHAMPIDIQGDVTCFAFHGGDNVSAAKFCFDVQCAVNESITKGNVNEVCSIVCASIASGEDGAAARLFASVLSNVSVGGSVVLMTSFVNPIVSAFSTDSEVIVQESAGRYVSRDLSEDHTQPFHFATTILIHNDFVGEKERIMTDAGKSQPSMEWKAMCSSLPHHGTVTAEKRMQSANKQRAAVVMSSGEDVRSNTSTPSQQALATPQLGPSVPNVPRTLVYLSLHGAKDMKSVSSKTWDFIIELVLNVATKNFAKHKGKLAPMRRTDVGADVITALFDEPVTGLSYAMDVMRGVSSLLVPEEYAGLPCTKSEEIDDGNFLYKGLRVDAGMHIVMCTDNPQGNTTFPVVVPPSFPPPTSRGGIIIFPPEIRSMAASFIDSKCAVRFVPHDDIFLCVDKTFEKRLPKPNAAGSRRTSAISVTSGGNVHSRPNSSAANQPAQSRLRSKRPSLVTQEVEGGGLSPVMIPSVSALTLTASVLPNFSLNPIEPGAPEPIADMVRHARRQSMQKTYKCCVSILLNGMLLMLHQDEDSLMGMMQTYTDLLRNIMVEFGGYEIRSNGYVFCYGFPTVESGMTFACRVHNELMILPIPAEFKDLPCCREVADHTGEVILNGLQACIGIHGNVVPIFDPDIHFASRLCTHCQPGAIRVSQFAYKTLCFDDSFVVIPVPGERLGNENEMIQSYYMMPKEMESRAAFVRERIHDVYQRVPSKYLMSAETIGKKMEQLQQQQAGEKAGVGGVGGAGLPRGMEFENNTEVVFVVVSLDNVELLSSAFPVEMSKTLYRYNAFVREIILQYNGYEMSCLEGTICCVFRRPMEAIQFSLSVQTQLMDFVLPKEIREHDAVKELKADKGQVMMRGLRAKIGLERGKTECTWTNSSRWDFSSPSLRQAHQLSLRCPGGVILLRENTKKVGMDFLFTMARVLTNVTPHYQREVSEEGQLVPEYYVIPGLLGKRAEVLKLTTNDIGASSANSTSGKGGGLSLRIDHDMFNDAASPLSPLLSPSALMSSMSFSLDGSSLEEKHNSELAVVLTDIQSSTALWNVDEVAMMATVNAHNKLLRSLLRKYRGYEVRTEGDAFYIVFESANDAMMFCAKAQRHLNEMPVQESLRDALPATKTVLGERGVKVFEGIRVRMVAHWGPMTCERDPVTNRLGFFGNTLQIAHALSSKAHGGCIKISQSMLMQSTDIIESEGIVVDMLSESMADGSPVYYVIPKQLAGRLPWFRKYPLDGSSEKDTELAKPKGEFYTGMSLCAVFTDIEGAKDLWETDDAAMMLLMHSHNSIMRDLLKKYRGYEVKTEGLAFMIVFREAVEALFFATEAQRVLMAMDLPALPQTTDGYSAAHDVVLKGLRLKVGFHFGRVRCSEDQVQKRWDFFGPTINLTARVCQSALGGTIKITQEAHDILEADLEEGEYRVVALPPDSFKGFEEKVECCYVFPRDLVGRMAALSIQDMPESVPAQLDPLAIQPVTSMAIVVIDVENSEALWVENDDMMSIMDQYNGAVTRTYEMLTGVECARNGTSFTVVFRNSTDALQFASRVSTEIALIPLPPSLGAMPCTQRVVDPTVAVGENDEVIAAGLRAVVTIHQGDLHCTRNAVTKKWNFRGRSLHTAHVMQESTPGGAFGMTSPFLEKVQFALPAMCIQLPLTRTIEGELQINYLVLKQYPRRVKYITNIIKKMLADEGAPMNSSRAASPPASPRRRPLCPTCGQMIQPAGTAPLHASTMIETEHNVLLHTTENKEEEPKTPPPPMQHFPMNAFAQYAQRSTSTTSLEKDFQSRYVEELLQASGKRRSMLDPISTGRPHGVSHHSAKVRPTHMMTSPLSEATSPRLSDDPFLRNKDKKVTKLLMDLEGSPFQNATTAEVNVFRPHIRTKKSNYKMFPTD